MPGLNESKTAVLDVVW